MRDGLRYDYSMIKSKSGFTIVELLIVIVVIGILAAIAIVAYNGVQIRARNTQQISVAKTYVSAFGAYVAANGAYPGTSGQSRYCIGIDVSACTTAPVNTWYRDTILENNLKTLISATPAANPSSPLASSPKMGYIPQTDVTLDGVATPFIIFTVESPGVCSISGLASGTWPNFSSAAPAQGYTFVDTGMRVCMVALNRAS